MFILLQKCVPQHLLSRLVGWVASSEIRWVKWAFIHFAIRRYQIDLSEALEPNPDAYPSFNAFFTRALKPDARPIESSICSPADGAISECGEIKDGLILQAKGIRYSLAQLLGGVDSEPYREGSFSTIYLAPRDYHRVHCPMSGHLTAARYIPGKLFSVNQVTANHIPGLFAQNERLVLEFESDTGKFCLILVGAMIVAGIQPVWRNKPYPPKKPFQDSVAERQFEVGDEIGRFLMGSTAIVIADRRLPLRHIAGDVIRMGEALTET